MIKKIITLVFKKGTPYLFPMSKHWTIKDKLEVAEALCTIIVTIMALWGTLVAFQHNLFQKTSHLIEHYHQKVIELEKEKRL